MTEVKLDTAALDRAETLARNTRDEQTLSLIAEVRESRRREGVADELLATLEKLERLREFDQHHADIVRTAMAFDEGGDFGALTSACARLRLAVEARKAKRDGE